MPSQTKPIASISLDLDDKWTYLKTHGDSRWSTYPSYLNIVIPRVLSFLQQRNLKITFFIVGQDAAFERNHAVLRTISEAGHEISNHSFRHEPWLHLYSETEIQQELESAENAIEKATGRRPIGFRGPGFSVSETVVKVLIARGYEYDASTLPTFLGPLARLYYFFNAKLDAEEKKKRAKLFGTLSDGLRPILVHKWNTPAGSITEIPVTTVPVIRTPFHLSYLIYLHSFSHALASTYMHIAFTACKWAGVSPSFLLHPLDFMGPDEAPELAFFPGMKLSAQEKLDLADKTFSALLNKFTLVSMREHASHSIASGDAAATHLRDNASTTSR
jgi:peptidoglycan/xylan/chitin deacetylase (PgdA/CDA1 family)